MVDTRELTTAPPLRRFAFGPFVLDAADRLLLRDGSTVALPPKVIDTLIVLVEAEGRVVTKEELMGKVWPDTFVEEGSLARSISTLRKALDEKRGTSTYIETLARRGYRFSAVVTPVVPGAAPAAVLGTESVPPAAPSQPAVAAPARDAHHHANPLAAAWRSRRALATLLALLLLGLAAWGGATLRDGGANAAVHAIAVLPFVPSDPADEYLGVGLADALVARLTRFTNLSVRSMATTAFYHAPNKDVTVLGRDLSVDAVVTGTIQRAGDLLRVNVRLTEVRDGRVVWAKAFDERPTGLMGLQDAVAQRVGMELAGKLAVATPSRGAATDNAEAYELYLRGRYLMQRHERDALQSAAACFRQAAEKDPSFAAALVGVADVATSQAWMDYTDSGEAIRAAEGALGRAMQIAPDLAEAHASLAYVRWLQWRWPDVEREITRALALDPRQATSYQRYATLYCTPLGRFEEAIRALRRARELDPVSPVILGNLGAVLYHAGRLDEAIRAHEQALELAPRYLPSLYGLGQVQAARRDYPRSERLLEQALEIAPNETAVAATLARVRSLGGHPQGARESLARLERDARPGNPALYLRASLHVALGEREQALQCLEQALQQRLIWLVWCNVERDFQELHGDPRFERIVRAVGLAR